MNLLGTTITIVPGPSVYRPDTILELLPTALEEEPYLHFSFHYSNYPPVQFTYLRLTYPTSCPNLVQPGMLSRYDDGTSL